MLQLNCMQYLKLITSLLTSVLQFNEHLKLTRALLTRLLYTCDFYSQCLFIQKHRHAIMSRVDYQLIQLDIAILAKLA